MRAATGKWAVPLLVVFGILAGAAAASSRRAGAETYVPTAEDLREGYQGSARSRQARGRVYKAQLTPHWFQNNTRFWYRNDLRGGAREFIVVDAERGTRR